MKTLMLLVLMSLSLTACNSSDGGSDVSSTDKAPASTPSPSPTPGNPGITCADFATTHWVINGNPSLNVLSADQSGHTPYVSEFDLSVANPTFIETQYLAGPGEIACTRVFDDGVQYGTSSSSLIWTDMTGNCSAVAQWIEFDSTQCNVLTITIHNGAGDIYETASYIPQ